MLDTLLIEKQTNDLEPLRVKIEKCCPCLDIRGQVNSVDKVLALFKEKVPHLAFLDPGLISCETIRKSLGNDDINTEFIFVSHSTTYTLEAINNHVVGYLCLPVEEESLILTVEKARRQVQEREERQRNKLLLEKLLHEKHINLLIGIPTLDGFDFLFVDEIIRCEGLQKCTRVVTTTKTDIISSYNIGEFRKLLEPYYFFSPHKSHLINLNFVKKYKREGSILLRDNSYVPISKRKKTEFLEVVIHL